MVEIQLIWAWVQARADLARQESERGDIVQTAIMIGLFAAGAIAVVAILVGKAKTAANKITP